MAQPPGKAIFAVPYLPNKAPNTRIEARIVLTNSYRASKLFRFAVEIEKFIVSSKMISAPMDPINSNIVVIS